MSALLCPSCEATFPTSTHLYYHEGQRHPGRRSVRLYTDVQGRVHPSHCSCAVCARARARRASRGAS